MKNAFGLAVLLLGMLFINPGFAQTGEELYEESQKYMRKHDYFPALEILEKAALQEHADSLFLLGIMHKYGMGVLEDEIKAQTLFKKAEQQYLKAVAKGDIDAQYTLALMYREGFGVMESEVIANQLLEKVIQTYEQDAAQGDAKAQFLLGGIYEAGNGVPRDCIRARWLYEKAAAQDTTYTPEAQLALGILYSSFSVCDLKDHTKARYYFHRACSDGLQDACDMLGMLAR